MKKLLDKWISISLIKRIIGGLALGIILGLLVPKASGIALFGSVFVGALKAIAPLLVFVLVISSLCHSGKSHGGVIKTVIILYMFSTILASVIAVFTSKLFPVTLTLTEGFEEMSSPGSIGDVFNSLLMNIVENPITSLTKANYVGILAWAVVIGIACRHAKESTKDMLVDISNGLSKVVTWIINFAPFGIMGLVFDTVSNNGMSVFKEYGKLLMLLVGTMLFIYFVTNPILVFWCTHKNPYPLVFRCLKKSALTAFFTRSSAANIPINMKECEDMGLDRDTYSVTIPLGATINMDGAAITITVMTLAAANTLGITVDIPSAILLSILAALSACGASGVAGGSLLLPIKSDMPFPECGAMSQGYIGYHLQNAIGNELASRGMNKDVATVVTQVLVDEADPAFQHPTKPVGAFYDKETADRIAAEKGYTMVEDAGRGYRQVVPSPKPIDVIEKNTVKALVDNGTVVITVGGGGIPVVRKDGKLYGTPAVIDKDFASAKLAELLDADMLVILTAVEKVAINFGKPDQKGLDTLTPDEARKYIDEKQFAPGSMLPKVQAAMSFAESKPGRVALITLLEKAAEGIEGKTGTRVQM